MAFSHTHRKGTTLHTVGELDCASPSRHGLESWESAMLWVHLQVEAAAELSHHDQRWDLPQSAVVRAELRHVDVCGLRLLVPELCHRLVAEILGLHAP